MSTEDLMKPRYKVIAQYFECEFALNAILTLTDDGRFFIDRSIEQKYYHGVPTDDIDNWPLNFKRMEWWEDRKPEDMPEYVKCDDMPDILKIASWVTSDGFAVGNISKRKIITMHTNVLPSTEQEHNEWLNKETKVQEGDARMPPKDQQPVT